MRPALPTFTLLLAIVACQPYLTDATSQQARAAIPEVHEASPPGTVRPPTVHAALPAMKHNDACLPERRPYEAEMQYTISGAPAMSGAPLSGRAAGLGGGPPGSPSPRAAEQRAASKAAPSRPPPQTGAVADLDTSGAVTAPPPKRTSAPQVLQLSNDDSMSLASAQRLLWAVEHGSAIQPSQIRPHELLNYFTFSAQAPTRGPLIEALPSVTRDGAQLKLAVSVAIADTARPPVDLTLIVDRSGSMGAEGRMDYVRKALQLAQSHLVEGDRVDLIVFDHQVCTALQDFVVGRDPASALSDLIDRMQPRGSTDLNSALQEGYKIARSHRTEPGAEARTGRVMVLTDAELNQGDINPDTVTQVGRELDAHKIRLTGVGVGSSFRDDVLNQLTEKGRGAYVFLGSEAVVERFFGESFNALIHTVGEDARFALHIPSSLQMERFYGEESSADPEKVTPVMLAAGSHQVFYQDLKIQSAGLDPNEKITFESSWTDPQNGHRMGRTFTWSLRELLASSDRDARKAEALMAWTDLLLARANGRGSCGAPWYRFDRMVDGLSTDAELTWVRDITAQGCSRPPETGPQASIKLRIDADQPVTHVHLDCDDGSHDTNLGAGESVAVFTVASGTCNLGLDGTGSLRTRVRVAPTGSQFDCRIRSGQLSCN